MKTFDNLMPHASFPIGGIGTGTISLEPNGRLDDFQIFNRPSLGLKIPYSFFSLFSRVGTDTDARAVEAAFFPDFYKPHGCHSSWTMGLPRFPHSEMDVRYPFAHIRFQDEKLPLGVEMTAFSPFVPLNADDSGIPGMAVHVDVTNLAAQEAEVLLAFSMGNIHNFRGTDCYNNVLVSPRCENIVRREAEASGLFMTGSAVSNRSLYFANNAILTPEPNAEICRAWYRGGWYDGMIDFWNHFRKGSMPEGDTGETEKFSVVGPPSCLVGSVGIRKKIPCGKTERFTFIISWYVPNRIKGWVRENSHGRTMKNYYALRYKDAWHAGFDLLQRLETLEKTSRDFSDALYASTLPEPVLDAVVANIATVRSTTCFRAPDGTLMAWEGSHPQQGSCHGTCTHVWNYAQTIARLFPALERSARLDEFLIETDSQGKMAFRSQQRFGLPRWEMYAAADGQFGTIMRAWREWKISGERGFLEQVYQPVLRAFDYALREWDSDGDGLADARQHNTYDIEFFGPNPLTAVLELGAIRAVQKMAEEMGDGQRADEMRHLFDRVRDRFQRLCWQGEYYLQRLDDVNRYPYQFGAGCLSDQLFGQTLACMCGLGLLLDEESIRSVLRAIYRYNFLDGSQRDVCLQRLYVADDEKGLVLCSWPHGDSPRFPFVYSNEVWTGVEYQVATLMIWMGMLDEALEIVAAVRSRYDGIRRNPWNEIECGFYYARSLASWGLLLAASGFDWDAPRRKICFQPRIASGNLFWTTGSAWGNVFFDENSLRISPRHSVLTLRCIQIPEGKTVCRVVANGTEIAFTQRGCEVDLPETEIGEGGVLAIEY